MKRALVTIALLALAACAAGRKPSAIQEPPTSAPPLSGRPDDLRAQIRELDAAIQQDLANAQIAPPDAAAAMAASTTPMADVRSVCEHVPSDRCEDVCTLSGSICDNASSICTLADQLPGDAWAAERCGAAKASCRRATERCCAGECAPATQD